MKIPKDLIRQKQLQAQMMFLMDIPIDQIAKEISVSDVTVNRWAKGMGWREARKQIADRVSKTLQDTVTEMRERHVKITRAIVSKGIQTLQKEDTEVRPGEIVMALKHEKEMIQPTEFKQLNFVKNETNIQNTQVNINKSIYDLIKEAKEKRWRLKDKSVMATLEQSSL